MRPLHATILATTTLMTMGQQARADVERDDCPSPLLRCSTDDDLAFEYVRARLSAEDNAGWVSGGYGLEIAAQLRFNVSVLGQNASWTGSLPTPF